MRQVGKFGYVRVRLVGEFGSGLVMLFWFLSWAAALVFIRGLILFVGFSCSLEVVVGVLRIVVCMSLVVSEAGPLLLFGRVSEARAF